jgi:hypothetical protein
MMRRAGVVSFMLFVMSSAESPWWRAPLRRAGKLPIMDINAGDCACPRLQFPSGQSGSDPHGRFVADLPNCPVPLLQTAIRRIGPDKSGSIPAASGPVFVTQVGRERRFTGGIECHAPHGHPVAVPLNL